MYVHLVVVETDPAPDTEVILGVTCTPRPIGASHNNSVLVLNSIGHTCVIVSPAVLCVGVASLCD